MKKKKRRNVEYVKLIQPRGKGTPWVIRVWLPEIGKYKKITTGTHIKAEADVKLKSVEEHHLLYRLGQRETALEKQNPILSTAVDEYLDYQETQRRSAKYIKEQRFVLNEMKDVLGPNTMVKEVSTAGVMRLNKRWKSIPRKCGFYKGKIGLSDSGINGRRCTIRSFFKWCIDMEYFDKALKGLDRINDIRYACDEDREHNRHKIITLDEFKKILSVTKDDVMRSYFKIAFYTGMRSLEVNSSEVITENGKMFFKTNITKKDGKGRMKKRYIPVDFKELLVDHAVCAAAQYKKGRVSKAFRQACKDADIWIPYNKCLHSNRRSWISYKLKDNERSQVVMSAAGHSHLETTEGYAEKDIMFYLGDEKMAYLA